MENRKSRKDNSLSKFVYQAIYKRILTGNLQPGEKITETNISSTMGISRAPVREAFKRLSEDRLVVLVPHSGCYITDLLPEEIKEIYEIRQRLECMALEYALDKFDVEELKKIKNQFLACRKLSSTAMARKETKLDSELHNLIAQKSGCRNLQEMLEKLRARVEVFRVREANYTKRAKEALEEHLKILNAILSKNKARAIKELEHHINRTMKNVLNNLKNSS